MPCVAARAELNLPGSVISSVALHSIEFLFTTDVEQSEPAKC
jgi:hypothetical protein